MMVLPLLISLFYRKAPAKLITQIMIRLIFAVMRALWPRYTLATTIDPFGRKAATTRGLSRSAADADSTRNAPFNRCRIQAAFDLFDTLAAMTFGHECLLDDDISSLRSAWKDRFNRLLKQARETDVFRHTREFVPKPLYKERRALLLESPEFPYEARMGIWSPSDYDVSSE